MPKLEDYKPKSATKKPINQFRSWDGDLLDKLKIEPNSDVEESTKKTSSQFNSAKDNISNAAESRAKKKKKEPLKNNKPITEPITKPETNIEQMDNKPVFNGEQSKHAIEEKENKVVTKPITIGKQSDNNSFKLSMLSGVQRDLIMAMYNCCRISGGKVTPELTLDHLTSVVNKPKATLKTCIYRLKEKNLIKAVEFKNGRAGWVRYEINADLFADLLQHEGQNTQAFSQQMVNKLVSQPMTEHASTESSSNSSSLNNNKTITYEELPEDWLNIYFDTLNEIGFKKHHLIQLYKLKLDPEVVQESIHHFCFDLYENKKLESYNNPLSVFFAVLRKEGAYLIGNYVSPKDKAQRKLLELRKQQQEDRQKREEEFYVIEYKSWRSTLTSEERDNILSEGTKKFKMAPAIDAELDAYFKNFIWPDLRKQFAVES